MTEPRAPGPGGPTGPADARTATPSPEWVEREVGMGVGATERLRAYRGFLAAARDRKARGDATPTLEREVVTQARAAQEDLRTLTGAALRVGRHLEATGLLGETLASLHRALGASGPVALVDLLADIVEDSTGRTALTDLGLSGTTLDLMSEVVGGLDLTLEADESGLRVRSAQLDRDVRLVERSRRAPLPSPAALVFGGLFDGAVEQWRTPGFVPLGGAAPRRATRDGPVVRDPLDAMLGAAVAARGEMARHVRKLEDTGLEVHAGRDPAGVTFIAAVIAGIASTAAIVGGGIKVICAASKRLDPGDRFCRAGDFLLVFALALFAMAAVVSVVALILQTAAAASS